MNEKFETEFQRMIPDKSSPVVVYSTNTASDAAPKAAKRLERAGYKAVYDYRGGKEEWKSAGYPVETGAH